MSMLKITIDGKQAEVTPGSMILDAANKLNVEIPTLCFLKMEELAKLFNEIENRI